MTERITSTANPRIKSFAKLKTSRERVRSGLFLIEGTREIRHADVAGVEISSLLVCPDLGEIYRSETSNHDVIEVTAEVMAKVAVRQNPPGSIAVATQFPTDLDRLEVGPDPLVLVVEAIEKPGNLGAMLRTADGAGVDAVIVADPGTDVFNPNVIRASQGALFTVPIAVAETREAVAWLRKHGAAVVGGYPEATESLWDADLVGSTALVVGAEDVGISPQWDAITTRVQIPLAGSADSLNASVAAAVLLFEAVRQRRPA